MIVFNAPSREFTKGEIIIANPEGRIDSFFEYIAISGGSIPFMANGVACSYGEPNPCSIQDHSKRIHGHFKHNDYITFRNFVDGVKYLHRFLVNDPHYFKNAIVDDGSLDVLKRCNGIINRAIQIVEKNLAEDPLFDKMMEQVTALELFDINLYYDDLQGAPREFPNFEDEIPVRLYMSMPQNVKDLISPV